MRFPDFLERLFFPEAKKLRARVRHLKWELSGYKRNLKIESRNVRDWRALAEKTRGELEKAERLIASRDSFIAAIEEHVEVQPDPADLEILKNSSVPPRLVAEQCGISEKTAIVYMRRQNGALDRETAAKMVASCRILENKRQEIPSDPQEALRHILYWLPYGLSIVAREAGKMNYSELSMFKSGHKKTLTAKNFEVAAAALDRIETGKARNSWAIDKLRKAGHPMYQAAAGSVPAGTPALPGEGV